MIQKAKTKLKTAEEQDKTITYTSVQFLDSRLQKIADNSYCQDCGAIFPIAAAIEVVTGKGPEMIRVEEVGFPTVSKRTILEQWTWETPKSKVKNNRNDEF